MFFKLNLTVTEKLSIDQFLNGLLALFRVTDAVIIII